MNTLQLHIYLDEAQNPTQALADAAAQAQREEKELFLYGKTANISDSLTVNVPVTFEGSLCLEVAEGCTLTFTETVTASPKQIFSGKGQVCFTHKDQEGYPQWFGAKGVGRDDTEAFQKAVDALSVLLVPNATYVLSDILISHPLILRGVGAAKVSVTAAKETSRLFTLQSSHVTVENLDISMESAPEGSICFYFDTSKAPLEDFVLRNLWVSFARTGLCDAKSGVNRINGLLMDAVDFRSANGVQLDMYDFDSNLSLIEVTVTRRENLVLGLRVNMPAAIFQNINQMLIEHFDVNGDAHVSSITNRYNFDPEWVSQNLDGHGAVFENCRNVRMIRSLAEYVSGAGFIIKNCSGFDFENVQPYTYHTYGIYAENLTDSRFEILKATGNGDITLPYENLFFKNCSNLKFTGVLSCESRGDALRLEGCKNITFQSYMATSGAMAAFADGGDNENVVFRSFISSYTKEVAKLTGSGVTIQNAIVENNAVYPVYTGQ